MANENQEVEHVEAVAVTANALEQMERANIDIQISTALAHPRSMSKFYERATAMVTFDAETARSCLYRRAVGQEGGQTVYAEGESIRMAEIVAASYGNIRVSGMIIEMTPRYVKTIGIAHDLESNYAVKCECVESTVNKYGQPFSERMRVVVAKACQKKSIRDATFSVIPKSLCKPLVIKAKEVAKGDIKTFEAKRKAVVEWIKKLKIEPKRVWNAVGIKGEADVSVEVLYLLYGLKTAIDEKDITIEEAFPKPEAEASKGSTYDRIKNKDKEAGQEKKSAPKKGKKTGEKSTNPKTESETETEPEKTMAPPEEPKLVKCPQCGDEVDPATHTCVTGPETEQPKNMWQCKRVKEHKFPEEKMQNGQCPFCFGAVEEIK